MTAGVKKILLLCCVGLLHIQPTNGSQFETCVCKFLQKSSTANCENHQLNNVPICVPFAVEHLMLSGNYFRTLKSRLFINVSALRTLDLEACRIRWIEDGAFEGLKNLTELSLAKNFLIYKNSITKNAFAPLVRLKQIWLQGNCNSAQRRNCSYYDKALSKLHSLTDIYLDGFDNVRFGEGFSHLKNIQSIRLESGGKNQGLCFLPHIKADMFDVLKYTNVKKIELVRCHITQVDPNVFRNFRNLTELAILSNPGLCGRGFYNLSMSLISTNISVLKIRDWCRKRPFELKIDDDVSELLRNTNLKYLEISLMRLKEISSFIAGLPKTLTGISFSKNEFDLRLINSFKRFTKLQKVDLSYQQIYFLPTINNSHTNAVQCVTNTAESSSQPIDLDMPENLEVLNVTNTFFDFPFNLFRFQENRIKFIDASNCMIGCTSGEIISLENLQQFDLSYNNMRFIHENTFKSMKKLKYLSLYHNNLGDLITENKKAFENLGSLKFLFLNNNGISTIPYDFFKSMSSLFHLNLAENQITVVDFSLMSLGDLSYLDLSSNNIATITQDNLQFLNTLPVLGLDLHRNKLSCTCSTKKFLYWLEVTSVYVLDKHNLTCRYQNKSLVNLANSNFIIDQLTYDCSIDEILLFTCIVLSMSVLSLSMLVVIFRKRWQIKYLYYIGKKSINPYHPLEGVNVKRGVDVFISYDIDEMLTPTIRIHNFVAEVVNPFLKRKNFVVKIREDKPPGRKVNFELATILQSSKKLVAFLSPNYASDYWNLFEFNMSVLEGINTKRKSLLEILTVNGSIYQLK